MRTIEEIKKAIESKRITHETETGKPISTEELEKLTRAEVKTENAARKAETLAIAPQFSADSVYNIVRVKTTKDGEIELTEAEKLLSIAEYVIKDKKSDYKNAMEALNDTLKLYISSGFNFATVSKTSIKKRMSAVMRCVYNDSDTLTECNAFDVRFLTYYSTGKTKKIGAIKVSRVVDAMSVIAYCRATECSYTVDGVIIADGKPSIEPPDEPKK